MRRRFKGTASRTARFDGAQFGCSRTGNFLPPCKLGVEMLSPFPIIQLPVEKMGRSRMLENASVAGLIVSRSSGFYFAQGVRVEVAVFCRPDDDAWSLSVTNENGRETAWRQCFRSEHAAWAHFEGVSAITGVRSFFEPDEPFTRYH